MKVELNYETQTGRIFDDSNLPDFVYQGFDITEENLMLVNEYMAQKAIEKARESTQEQMDV